MMKRIDDDVFDEDGKEGDTMNMAISKPREATVISKEMTKSFLSELAKKHSGNKCDNRTSKKVSSSVMEQMKRMCEGDK